MSAGVGEEDLLLLQGCYRPATVTYRDDDPVIPALVLDENLVTAVADRIGEQIPDDLTESDWVGYGSDSLTWLRDGDATSIGIGEYFHYLGTVGSDIDHDLAYVNSVDLGPRGNEQVLHDAGKVISLLCDRRRELVPLLIRQVASLVQKNLGEAHDRRKRSPQLVAHRGNKFVFRANQVLETLCL